MSVRPVNHDVFEVDEDEDQFMNTDRYDQVDTYELGLGDDFEDEEIDEDNAFDQEDENIYGEYFNEQVSRKRKRETDLSDEVEEIDLNEDDESDENLYQNLSDLLDNGDEDNMDIEKHNSLVKKLSSFKKKAEKTEGRVENEFNLTNKDKVSLNDLLKNVSEDSEFSGLRKNMERLVRAKKKRKIDAPTAKRLQNLEVRKTQFESTKNEVSEWQPVVKEMREAPHLNFPLKPDVVHSTTSKQLSHSFQPQSDMEKEIFELLKVSNIDEKKIIENEELYERDLSVDEIKKREEEIAKLKRLMFYKEMKLKRRKKIKSKKYRAILRKQKQKEQELTYNELLETDPEAAKEYNEKKMKSRNLERMTLRHKRFGSWAEYAKKSKNPSLKEELQEHYERGKKLREKIEGVESDESSFEIEENISEDDSISEEMPKKGIMAMKFMQRAHEKQKQEYNELKEQMETDDMEYERRLLNNNIEKNEKNEKNETDFDQEIKGRKSFSKPKGPVQFNKDKVQSLEGNSHLVEEVAMGNGFKTSVSKTIQVTPKKVFETPDFEEENVTMNENNKDSKTYSINKTKISPVTPKQDKKKKSISIKKKETEEGLKLSVGSNQEAPKVNKPPANISAKNTQKNNDKKENPWMKPDDENEEIVKGKNNNKLNLENIVKDSNEKDKFNLISQATEEQKEFIKRAFANDDVEASFTEEKKKLIDDLLPEELLEKGVLPGWGSWTGEGIVNRPNPKKEKEKDEKRKSLEKKLLSERKDSHLKHVIINHKRDKKLTKYKTSELPYPYNSKEAYEKSLKHPLGKDWNTISTHSAIIKPRIIKKRGAIIEPIDKKAKKKSNN